MGVLLLQACLCLLLVHASIELEWHLSGRSTWSPEHEDLLLYEAFAVLLGSYVHLVVSMVHEVSRALGIYAFTITR